MKLPQLRQFHELSAADIEADIDRTHGLFGSSAVWPCDARDGNAYISARTFFQSPDHTQGNLFADDIVFFDLLQRNTEELMLYSFGIGAYPQFKDLGSARN